MPIITSVFSYRFHSLQWEELAAVLQLTQISKLLMLNVMLCRFCLSGLFALQTSSAVCSLPAFLFMKTVVILSLCALAFALGMFFDGLITRVPEESKVVTQMRVIERELKIYHRQHETLPPTLADLQRFSPCIERCLTNSWGRPDLDLRPAPMYRDTMNVWLMECPHCGYVAKGLNNELKTTSDILKSEEYLTCEGNDFKSDLSKRFYRRYLISKAEKEYNSEFYSLLHCAWACDDADDGLAVEMRKLAVNLVDKVDDENENLKLIKADLLRRSLQFERLIEEYSDFKSDDELSYSIIRFQLGLAAMKDSDCYTIQDVFNEFNPDE